MPVLREKLPGVKFLIYGASLPSTFEKIESDDVIMKGYVKDLWEVFKSCRVFVAPLLSGAGIKGKVIEALSYGIPSVLSPIAAEGTGIRNGYEALIAEKPEEFTDAVYKLYTDKKLWEKISKNALDFVKSEYSFEKGQEKARKALGMVDIYVPENVQAMFMRKWNG